MARGRKGTGLPSGSRRSLDEAIKNAFFGENASIGLRDDGTVHVVHHQLPKLVNKVGTVQPDQVKQKMRKLGFDFTSLGGSGKNTKWQITPPPQS